MEILKLQEVGVKKAVEKAVAVLKKGGIIIYPTDTLYGLGVDARNADAITRLKELKGRESKKPISVIVSDITHMAKCGVMNESAKILAAKFLPGPLTLVLPAHPSMPTEIQLNGALGIRIPKDEFCSTLAHAYQHPITTTSANVSGLPTKRTVQDIIWHFGPSIAHIELVIDAGELRDSAPSTVVRCTDDTPYVLREGAIPSSALGI